MSTHLPVRGLSITKDVNAKLLGFYGQRRRGSFISSDTRVDIKRASRKGPATPEKRGAS